MKKYEATIHTECPIIIEIEADSTELAAKFVDSVHTGPAAVTISEIKSEVVATIPKYENTFREWDISSTKAEMSYEGIVKRLWVIADGVGQRDSLDTFAQLVHLIAVIEREP